MKKLINCSLILFLLLSLFSLGNLVADDHNSSSNKENLDKFNPSKCLLNNVLGKNLSIPKILKETEKCDSCHYAISPQPNNPFSESEEIILDPFKDDLLPE